jgi:chromosome segregation ATPase
MSEERNIHPEESSFSMQDLEDPKVLNALLQYKTERRSEIATSKDNIKDAKVKLKTVKKEVAVHEDDIVDAQIDINDAKKKMATVKKGIAVHENNIADAQTDIENIDDTIVDLLYKKFHDISSTLSKMQMENVETNHNIKWICNRQQFLELGTFVERPFVVGERPTNLPIIKRVEDINSLTLEQVRSFLIGYSQSTVGDINDLKKRLAKYHAIPTGYLSTIY